MTVLRPQREVQLGLSISVRYCTLRNLLLLILLPPPPPPKQKLCCPVGGELAQDTAAPVLQLSVPEENASLQLQLA